MRTLKQVLVLSSLIMASGLLTAPAQAQNTATVDAVTPYSWPQQKQQGGLPSTPTILDDSDQSDGRTTALPLPYMLYYPLQQVRSYLLGNYSTVLPPVGPNNFLDLEEGTGVAGVDSLEAWVGPFNGDTAGANQSITVDDDNSLNTESFYESTTATTFTTLAYGVFGTNGGWTNLSNDQTYDAGTAPPTGTSNFYGDSYLTIPAVNRSVEDSNDNGFSPNFAQWVPYITTPGYYSVQAWFPSENLTATTPEPHVSDARYKIYVKFAGQQMQVLTATADQVNGGSWVTLDTAINMPVTSQLFKVVQSGTPAVPANISLNAGINIVNPAIGDQFVAIRLDDTTNNSLTQTVNPTTYHNVVVADAIQIRSNDGSATRSLATPVAVNITPPILAAYPFGVPPLQNEVGTVGDYSEIALGYGGGNPNGDGAGIGGFPISYVTDSVVGATGSSTSSPNPQYYNGSVGYNAAATSRVVTPPAAVPTGTAIPATKAIDQVVYYTRTETINTDPSNPTQGSPVGFLYCANGQTGDIIWRFPNVSPITVSDIDPAVAFTSAGFVLGQSTNSSTSYNGETYGLAGGSITPTATANWIAPPSVAGKYYVYVYFPSQSATEGHVPDAHYSITDGNGNTYACNTVNQQVGGSWVQLTAPIVTGGETTVFNFASTGTAGVHLSNLSSSNQYVVADAVEFVPTTSMATSDSTPAVVRNMRVWDPNLGYISRSVVIAADNSGKVYCVDAAGNGDGNDILLDANNLPIYEDSAGTPWEDAAHTVSAVLPLHPTVIGTTHIYWIWQPNTSEPIGGNDIINVDTPAPNVVTNTFNWTADTLDATAGDAYGNETFDYETPAVNPQVAPPTNYFTYAPVISATQVGGAHVLVWSPGSVAGETHITDAQYTVVDSAGTSHVCIGVNQQAGPGFVELTDATTGQSVFTFDNTGNNGKNLVLLGNSTNNAVPGTSATPPVVIADAIELVFTSNSDANSNLIAPLAFGTCSPTVHVTPAKNGAGALFPVTSVTYNGNTTKYDQYSAKIYIGNMNGVLYALDGTGFLDGGDPYQRDYSQDPSTPSPSVDWWFNVGVTAKDSDQEIIDAPGYISASIAGTPAYYHPAGNTTTSAYDQILFTTYSPTDATNNGTLYSVNAQGPVGDYGESTPPDSSGVTDYRSAAGGTNYNLSPIPFFSFPDAYGQLHDINGAAITALPATDHLVTSRLAPVNGLVPPAGSLGNAAGSPAIFGNGAITPTNTTGAVQVKNPNGGGLLTMPPEVYFAADDPTTDGSAATEGRIWGVNLATGTVDAGVNGINSYIYPEVNGPNPFTFDPNTLIGTNDPTDITTVFDTVNGNINTLQFGPFSDGPVAYSGGQGAYFISSSPAVGIVHTIPNSGGNTLTDTLIGGGGYPIEYGGATGAYDIDVPMLYVGDVNGVLHSLNLAGFSDDSRFIQDATLDGSAIVSTPALLVNGNGPNIANNTGNNVGGVLFATTSSGDLWESEAFPFIEAGLQTISGVSEPIARNVDFAYGGPGGVSSVASSSFNIDNFQFTTAASANVPTGTITAGTTASVDTSEWVYASGDNGFTYGLTPDNTSFGNGGFTGGFDPGQGILPSSVSPQGNIVPLNRNFVTSVFPYNPIPLGTTSTSFIPWTANGPYSGRPPQAGVFDWGQTAYIVIYGLDDPNAGITQGTVPSANYPRAINVTFSIGPAGTNFGPGVSTKTINLQAVGAVVKINKNVTWPPSGYELTDPTNTSTSEVPEVGDYAAVYAYQLGNGEGTDPQTPGATIQIQNLKEQAQYFTGTPPNIQMITTVIAARSSGGTVIRTAVTQGTPPTTVAKDVVEPGIDQATFSILNPLAVRTSARSLGDVSANGPAWYNIALASQSLAQPLNELGPFSGVPINNEWPADQGALTNGNSVPLTQPLGGTMTNADGTLKNSNDPSNSSTNNINREISVPVVTAVAPGLVSDGTNSVTATVSGAGITDPAASASSDSISLAPVAPSNTGPGSYGQSMLNVADRSATGDIDLPITLLRVQQSSLAWNDNSGLGGSGAVINALRWDQMPTAMQPSGSGSADYPNIASGSTSFDMLARENSYNAAVPGGAGSTTVITSANGTLPIPTYSVGAPEKRIVYPAPVLINAAVPKFQPANLEEYVVGSNILTQGTTRLKASNANIANGYIGKFRVYVNSQATVSNSRKAFRSVQLWVDVPASTRTAISESTVDIGTVPAGFGVNLLATNGNPIDNVGWSPFDPNSTANASPTLFSFYKPFTLVADTNVNLINVHLNQYVNYGNTPSPTLEPNAFSSYTTSGLSTIPTFDVDPNGATGYLTGTYLQPLLRSSIDYFYNNFVAFIPNPYLAGGTVAPPGPTIHKPRPGDTVGTVASVPDTPYGNVPNRAGSTNLPSYPYAGRTVLSVLIPLGTPAGTYSQTVTAFEGTDGQPLSLIGPVYNGKVYTNNGWQSVPRANANGYDYSLGVVNGGTAAVQQQSNPGTTVKVTVGEDRITDGSPLPITNSSNTITGNAVLPLVDATTGKASSNDLQPWAFYDASGNSAGPSFGLIWTSQRYATANKPNSLVGSTLVAKNNLLNTPSGSTWWTAPNQLTDTAALPSGTEQSFGGSTYPSLVNGVVGSPINALFVTTTTDTTGLTTYSLNTAPISYTGTAMSLGTPTVLFTSSTPIFSPRAQWCYSGTGGLLGFTLTGAGAPGAGPYPLVVYNSRIGGRSTIMYWPAVVTATTQASNGVAAVNSSIIAPAPLALPSGLSDASTPTVIPRAPVAPVAQLDVVFSGQFGTSANTDVFSARYALTVQSATGTPVLTETSTLPTAAISPQPATGPTVPFVEEPLTSNDGGSTWQARDVAWRRDINSFQLNFTSAASAVGASPATSFATPLIPAPNSNTPPPSGVTVNNPVYDRASGKWIFVINWANLALEYPSPQSLDYLKAIENWWGVMSPATASNPTPTPINVVAYVDVNSGAITFSVPMPTSRAIPSFGNFTGLTADFNPQVLRATFMSQSNTTPISFIDSYTKPNAAPLMPAVTASRYWYIYRKQNAKNGNSAATASVIYYNTRRLTVVLPYPIQLTQTNTNTYGITNLIVSDSSGNNITGKVDVDWARGRLYFPEQYQLNGNTYTSEGQYFTVTYAYTNGTTVVNGVTTASTGTYTTPTPLVASWQDEPLVNSATQQNVIGEHILPVTAPSNESEPSAFLDPSASNTGLNPSTVTPASLANNEAGQPYAHKVWVFWTSTRNASSTTNAVNSNAGSDIYWETIDPRFEVINP